MLMKKLTSRENVTRAFENALTERFTDEHAMFQSENTHAQANKNEIIDSLIEELKSEANYQPRLGFYYEVPKSSLVDRPVVYLPFEELVVHYAFIQVIADVLDPQLLGCCFANRLNRRPKEKRLSQKFADVGWPRYCKWQENSAEDNTVMLVTDLSSFFDNIDRELLLKKIASGLGTAVDSSFLRYFNRVLSQPVIRYSTANGAQQDVLVTRNKGITTGPACNGVLANFYLMDVDLKVASLSGISFGRYVDDIKIFGQSRPDVLNAFKTLQSELYSLGLAINSSKTRLLNSQSEILQLLTKEVVVGHDYHGEPEIVRQTLTVELSKQELILDQSFDDREIIFDCDKGVVDSETAKQFCFYLSAQDERDWTEADILRLVQIVKYFPSSIKHATWLMVAALNHSEEDAFDNAFQFVTKELLQSQDIHEFGKSRVLHHLLKQRDRSNPYLFDIEGLASDSTFRKAIAQQAKFAQSTLLRIYAKETLFQLINENDEFTNKEFIRAYVEIGIRLNQAELRVMSLFEPVEVLRISPEDFQL